MNTTKLKGHSDNIKKKHWNYFTDSFKAESFLNFSSFFHIYLEEPKLSNFLNNPETVT
jgi:hypothetical protein